MKTKKIILISCFIIILVSLNTISAITSEDINSTNEFQQTTDNVLTENKELKQEINYVYVNGNSESDNEDGSIDSPYKTINDENLQKISPNSTVYVSEGTYNLNPTTFDKDISIIGENRENVIFVPNESQSIFTIGNNCNVNFFNFTFKNFESDTNSAIINKGNLILENINMINNTGTSRTTKKGNIFNEGYLEIRNSTFENNTASFAAAIYNTGNAIILSSDFNHNHIYNVGGALYSVRGNLTVYDSKFSKNSAVSGAAIYNAAGYLYVNNTEFVENDAEHFYGGAIYSTGVSIVNNSIFDSNHANMDGGAITNTNNFTVINCSFLENFAEDNGGVIENVPWSENENGNLTIFNSTFIENAAGNQGGVIINYNKKEAVGEWATVTVKNCLFELNSATSGGVIYNEQYIDFQNNVFIDNEADEYNVIYSEEDSITSLENNWWGSNTPSSDEIGVMPNKWIVLNFVNTTSFVPNSETKLQVSINTNNMGEKLNTTIPERIAIFSSQKTILPENNLKINSTLNYTINYLGDNITVCVDNQYLTLGPSNKMEVVVSYEPIGDVGYNDNVTIVGRVVYNNSIPIKFVPVTVDINGDIHEVTSDGEGYFKMNYTVDSYDDQIVTFRFDGNDLYLASSNSTMFKVKRPSMIRYAYMGNVELGSVVNVVGRLVYNNSIPIKFVPVTVDINGDIHEVTSDGAGYVKMNYTVNSYDDQVVTFRFNGNNLYLASSNSTTFKVKQPSMIRYAYMGNVKLGSVVSIVGRVVYNNSNPIKFVPVSVDINGQTYNLTSDGAGYVKMNYTVDSYDDQIVTFKFNGNRFYLASSNSTTFKVKQPSMIKYAYMGNVKLGSVVSIVGRVVYNNSNPIKYVPVSVDINGQTYNLTSDGAGYVKMNFTVDSYDDQIVTFKFNGNRFYLASSNSTMFKVKQPSMIKYAYIGNVKAGSTAKIVARLLYNQTNPIKYVPVTLKINGDEFEIKSDGAGYIKMNYTANTVGTNNITTTFTGNRLYLATTNSTTFTVIKT